MSMSCLMVHWLESLSEKKIFPVKGSILEFGPQGLTTPRPVIEAVARRCLGALDGQNAISQIYDVNGGAFRYHESFYSIFGGSHYYSLDPFDSVADYDYDLNHFVPIFRRFDVVTNFGTSEHVFEVGKVFKTAYRLLRPGGLLLCVLPAFGDIDHGFFNIHPVFYRTLAQHSGFELCDLQYIDDIARRTEEQCQNPTGQFQFSSLPIQINDMLDESDFKKKVLLQFLSNNAVRKRDAHEGIDASPVFDYCFVALRRKSNVSFKNPYQYASSSQNSYRNILSWVSLKFFRRKLIRSLKAAFIRVKG